MFRFQSLFRFLVVFLVMMAMLMAAITGSALQAAEPPKEPILKIETAMHTAKIGRIGVDAENRFLVTASEDKTVRVWELPSGRLLTVLRPPAGPDNEGKIFAVAISPDGKTVACGGWTGWDWDGKASIYLFDRATGEMTRRIEGLPNVITHLSYSPDGAYLAAALGGAGIRVFRAANGALIGEDKDYGDSYSIVFDQANRIAAASFDGYIRLYAPPGAQGLRLLAKEKAPGGKQPFSLAFSPDGTKLVACFYDSTRVDVLSAKNLSFLYSPDTGGVNNGYLISVAFSSDGRHLYAAGGYHNGNQCPIFAWESAGKGERRELAGASNTINDILPLKAGGIVYGAGDPAFGVIDKSHARVLFQTAQIADYRSLLNGFKLSPDGKKVSFGYEVAGKSPATFDMEARALIPDQDAQGLFSPDTTGLNITDWNNSTAPKLNGRALKLRQHETSFSLAVAPGKDSFLLGTHFYLRYFDQHGHEKWQISVPDAAWSVNIARDGQLCAAAFGDGTIRWYRVADGKELLAFFPHNDRKRWILWSASGYYDASPGGEELIGWHINNGKDKAADFFPASRFRSTYYRPDIIAKILPTGNESEAVRFANEDAGRKTQKAELGKILPPVVTILSPLDSETLTQPEVTITYMVRSSSPEPITIIRALIDGRPARQERGLKIVGKGTQEETLKITIPEKDCEISLIAENRFAASEPATVRVLYRGKTKSAEEFVVKPKLYVLAVGVSLYQDKSLTLQFAAKDAKDFAQAMEKQKGGLYRDVQVRLLTDALATRDEVMDGLDWIQKETTAKDVAMVFIAGHGVNDPTGNYYFLPGNVDTEKLKRTGVVFSDIKNTLNSLAGKALFFMDTCHSGNVMGSRRAQTDITGLVNELASAENGVVVFASSTGKQYSLEDASWGNGAFTKALVEGLSGKADYTGKGKITINMLDLYISEKVKELTGGKQTPTTTKPQTIADFPIAVKR
ncbi:MAG: caspase family protein [Smithellaceae bacterium]|nr:caspase family protein [Smithellaceae bacterium]